MTAVRRLVNIWTVLASIKQSFQDYRKLEQGLSEVRELCTSEPVRSMWKTSLAATSGSIPRWQGSDCDVWSQKSSDTNNRERPRFHPFNCSSQTNSNLGERVQHDSDSSSQSTSLSCPQERRCETKAKHTSRRHARGSEWRRQQKKQRFRTIYAKGI